jgi:hypothetical protein
MLPLLLLEQYSYRLMTTVNIIPAVTFPNPLTPLNEITKSLIENYSPSSGHSLNGAITLKATRTQLLFLQITRI